MKRVVVLLFALSAVALPALAAKLPRPISPCDRMRMPAKVHASLSSSKAEKSLRGSVWSAIAIPPAPARVSHSVEGK